MLLAIDELPIFLKRVLRGEDGAERSDEFLSWVRGVFQSIGDGSPVLPTALTISILFGWARGTATPASSVSSILRKAAD